VADSESNNDPLARSDSSYRKDLHRCYNLLWKTRAVELLQSIRHAKVYKMFVNNGLRDHVMHDMLDFRYFYYQNGHENTTCDFARQAAVNSLRSVYDPNEFVTPKWFDSLPSGSNAVVLGFLVEEMLLSWISVYRFLGAHSTFKSKSSFSMTPFRKCPPPPVSRFTFPSKYNYPAIDAIMVFINNNRAQAVVAEVPNLLVRLSYQH